MSEAARRREVIEAILQRIKDDRIIRISDHFDGELKGYRYSFEGEDDLLHLAIERVDKGAITVEEAQGAVAELLTGVPTALIWLKPGERSHHFYMGHDDLAASIKL